MIPETQTALRERLSEIEGIAADEQPPFPMRPESRRRIRTLAREARALLPPEPAAGQAQEPTCYLCHSATLQPRVYCTACGVQQP